MTKQRQVIYQVIQESEKHMTAEDIYLQAKRKLPSLSIATVYRNLNLMVECREIKKVSGETSDYFDRNVNEHGHLICIKCGRIKDIFIPAFKNTLELQTGCPVLSYELKIHYICSECSGKKETS